MINSIDMTTMLPRTAEAADVQGREVNQMQHATNQTALQFQRITEHNAQQTVETQKSETEEYDMDGSGGNKSGNMAGRNRKKREKKEEAPMAPRSSSSFDITI